MISAVIVAGGLGERFGSRIPKPFMSLNGKPVIQWSLDVIEPLVDEIVVVATEPYRDYRHVPAGPTRSASVRNGVSAVSGETVLVHDAVRPFITTALTQQVLAAAEIHPSVDTAVPIVDGYLIDGIPASKRGRMLGQTPEVFDRQRLLEAFALADRPFDDEVSMMWVMLGIEPLIIPGVQVNSKITFPEDLANAEGIMRHRCEPLTTPGQPGKVLLFGGTGGIGQAIRAHLDDCDTPTRSEIDLGGPFTVDLAAYDTVIHAAGAYTTDVMAVNFDSVVALVEQAEHQGWRGNIVVFSSTAATYGRPGIGMYAASKAALNTWLESRHDELAATGIYLNAIAPAKVDTRLQHTINPDTPRSEMMTPQYVAERTLPYLDTATHGHVVYLRYGLDLEETA